MASTTQNLFGRTVTNAVTWAAASVPHAVLAAAGLGVAAGLGLVAARAVRRARTEAAARRKAAIEAGETPAESMDPFTVYVTLMAMFLSINGMWHVFTETMHLPWVVRLVACTVLESSGLAFMRLARKDILRKRPATRHVAIVWAIAVLSGGLSASASHSFLEAAIRLFLPALAVQLCHSWMLPLPTEVTLTQHEKGKRAWRYVRATRRLDRAGNVVTIWFAAKRLNMESDRLTRRSLMTGDATAVLAAAERIAITEALAGLKVSPTTVLTDPDEADESEGTPDSDPEGPAISDSRTLAALIDGLSSADSRTLASVIAGLAQGDTDGSGLALGPGEAESEGSSDPGSEVVDPVPVALPATPAQPLHIPAPPQYEAEPEPLSLGYVPQQRTNVLTGGSGPAAWSQQSAAARQMFANPFATPAGGSVMPLVPESGGPVADSSDSDGADPWTPESEITGPISAPESVPESVDLPEESEGPDPAAGSEQDTDPESEAESAQELAALPWPVETSRITRKLVDDWRSAGREFTRAELLTAVRARKGSVSNKDRAAFWAWAIAPDIPSAEDELELVGAANTQ
jgi:hypothetical protein